MCSLRRGPCRRLVEFSRGEVGFVHRTLCVRSRHCASVSGPSCSWARPTLTPRDRRDAQAEQARGSTSGVDSAMARPGSKAKSFEPPASSRLGLVDGRLTTGRVGPCPRPALGAQRSGGRCLGRRIESREDLSFESDGLKEAIHVLANPLLEGPLDLVKATALRSSALGLSQERGRSADEALGGNHSDGPCKARQRPPYGFSRSIANRLMSATMATTTKHFCFAIAPGAFSVLTNGPSGPTQHAIGSGPAGSSPTRSIG